MKTSNKLLLIPILLILLIGLTSMILLKNSFVPNGIGNGSQLIIGAGPLKKKQLPVGDFKGVIAQEGMEWILVKGKQDIEIEAQENLLPYFETEMGEEQWLKIKIQEGYSIRTGVDKPIKIRAGYETLELLRAFDASSIIVHDRIESDGLNIGVHHSSHIEIAAVSKTANIGIRCSDGSSLSIKDTLVTGDLKLNVSNSGQVRILTNTQATDVRLSDGATLELAGKSASLTAKVNNSGQFKANNFTTATANIKVSDGANVQLHVIDYLTATANNSGYISYTGNPKVDKKEYDGGRVEGRR